MANKTVTVRPSGGDYTTLAAAITGEVMANANLTAAGMDGILTISTEGTWTENDTTQAYVADFITDATHYLKIINDGATGYKLYTAGDRPLRIASNFVRVIGLYIGTSSGTSLASIGFNSTCDSPVIENCTIVGSINGFRFSSSSALAAYIINCVCYGYSAYGTFTVGAGINAYIYNSTFAGGTHGLYSDDAGYTWTVKNCYFGNSSTADIARSAGTVNLTTTYTEDGSLSTSTAAFSTSTFTNVTGGSEDFTLVSGSSLIGAGTDLRADATWPFDYDIIGTTRGAAWDAGAFEYVSAGGISIPVAMHHRRMMGVS